MTGRVKIIRVTTEIKAGRKEPTTEVFYECWCDVQSLTLMQEVVASNTTGIVESVTQFQKDAVIDEYTQQLIEEGLI